MQVSLHPKHRSPRAELPHLALASGHDAKADCFYRLANPFGCTRPRTSHSAANAEMSNPATIKTPVCRIVALMVA